MTRFSSPLLYRPEGNRRFRIRNIIVSAAVIHPVAAAPMLVRARYAFGNYLGVTSSKAVTMPTPERLSVAAPKHSAFAACCRSALV
jgi:hypothetical protein